LMQALEPESGDSCSIQAGTTDKFCAINLVLT
jgi:hypothetical protein